LSFSAVHRVRLPDGTTEPLHGHDWIVRASFARNEVDATGMVIDFQDAKVALDSIVRDLHHTNLNDHDGLAGRNPTAEVIARYVFERLVEMGLLSTSRVEVTEAPGCVAAFSRTRLGADAG
jgi:6-pyruvoyltetrahydropterin/6-carboxytetrahydropterin synthase